MSYPATLSYFLDRLSGYSTNYFKLEPQNQKTAVANQIIRFTLPSNALLNMRSFALHFNATISAGSGGRLPAKIDTLIDRVEVSAGGVQLSAGANYYNVLRHAKDALMGDRTCPALGHPDIVRRVSYVDGSNITGTNNEVLSSANDSTQFAIDHFEGFLGSCEPKILDSSLMPDLVVSIYLADNAVCTTSAGITLSGAGATDIDDNGTGSVTYQLNNIHATIETIGLADAVYDNMISGMISQQGFIEVPFKQYFSFQDVSSGQTRFSVATQSLDRLWVAHRVANFDVQAAPSVVLGYKVEDVGSASGKCGFDEGGSLSTNKEKYIGNFYQFAEPASATKVTYQFQLNGAYIPQYRASFEEMYEISKNSVLGKPQEQMGLATLKNDYAVHCVRLNLPESEFSRLISGLDTRSVSLNGYYNMSGLSGTPTVNLFAEITSTLRVGSGKMLEVVQ